MSETDPTKEQWQGWLKDVEKAMLGVPGDAAASVYVEALLHAVAAAAETPRHAQRAIIALANHMVTEIGNAWTEVHQLGASDREH